MAQDCSVFWYGKERIGDSRFDSSRLGTVGLASHVNVRSNRSSWVLV